MKLSLNATLVGVALLLATAAAQGAGSMTIEGGAFSVADMLQGKQNADLRAQLVREGRSLDVRQLDEATAHYLQTQRDERYQRMNDDLARGHSGKGPLADASAIDCEPSGDNVR
jgi:hypothetical protein